MKVAYVDMIGGAAGDMLMGAWVDAGVDVRELERALRSVVAEGWELVTERVDRAGVSATHLDLVIPGEDDRAHAPDGTHHHAHAHHGHRLADILAIVERSGLSTRAIERAIAIFRRLAQAEARVHGQSVDDMVFHAVGQIDAILDVAGTCVALDLLGIEELRVSPFPLGHGVSRSGHSNPGPAVLELTRGFPVRQVDVEAQLVTETGAAILTTLAPPGPPLEMTLERTGYGGGRKAFAFPNVVRVTIGPATRLRTASV
jgi:pyridinium-3,5-bisthiocarboxylic acid mononucleotide nickel chelatase